MAWRSAEARRDWERRPEIRARANELARQRRANAPEKRRAYRRQPEVREQARQQMIAWRNANPEKWREIQLRSHERRKSDPRKWELAKKRAAAQRAKEQAKKEALANRPRPDKCEVCNSAGRIVWDHDHGSGKFRGWLCDGCNAALGFVGDDPDKLEKLAKYLRDHSHG